MVFINKVNFIELFIIVNESMVRWDHWLDIFFYLLVCFDYFDYYTFDVPVGYSNSYILIKLDETKQRKQEIRN